MYTDWYEHTTAPLRAKPACAKALNVLDKALVIIVAAFYLGVLAWLAATADARLIRTALVPALGFIAETALRAAINAPRPYEVFPIDPLIKKDTRGKSLPSRHIFSAAIIAFALGWIEPVWGIAAAIACAIVCLCRILGGVHFPRDVAAALLFASLCAGIGFILIP